MSASRGGPDDGGVLKGPMEGAADFEELVCMPAARNGRGRCCALKVQPPHLTQPVPALLSTPRTRC